MNCTTRKLGGTPRVEHYIRYNELYHKHNNWGVTFSRPLYIWYTYIHTYLYMYVQDQNIKVTQLLKIISAENRDFIIYRMYQNHCSISNLSSYQWYLQCFKRSSDDFGTPVYLCPWNSGTDMALAPLICYDILKKRMKIAIRLFWEFEIH